MPDPIILITGATGTVGGHLVRQLAAKGARLRALLRDPAKAAGMEPFAEVAIADLLKPETLAPAFSGVDAVFVAAPPMPELETIEANAFAAAKQAGVQKIVYLSNFGAGKLSGELWQAHGRNEEQLRQMDVAWTILRPARFMTNTPFSWTTIRDTGILAENTGTGAITVIDPADIAAVAAQALSQDGHTGQTYELTSDDALTARSLAQIIGRALGRRVSLAAGSAEAKRALTKAGFPPPVVDTILLYMEAVAQGQWYRTQTVEQVLGRKPKGFSQWLAENPPKL